jgi:hypothetical protein
MQFAIGVTVLECSFVKHSHGPLGVNIDTSSPTHTRFLYVLTLGTMRCLKTKSKMQLLLDLKR